MSSLSPRTLLGPLTTTWQFPPICSYAMALCDTCTTVWLAQSCNQERRAHDNTDCWPPRAASVTSDPGVMMGWGLYSPGLYCPDGYTSAAFATEGGETGWDMEYEMNADETAVACCPPGYEVSWIEATSTFAQTCVTTVTSSVFPTVQCDEGAFSAFESVEVPMTVDDEVFPSFVLFAPLIQLNYRPQDLPEPTTTPPPDSTSAAETTSAAPAPTTSSGPTSSTEPSVGPSPAPPSLSSPSSAPASGSSGLSAGAKAGIGVGVSLAILVALLAIFLLRRRRRRQPAQILPVSSSTEKKPSLDDTPTFAASTMLRHAELDGEEVKELDGAPRPQELAMGTAARPHGPVFELEADTPTSVRSRASWIDGGEAAARAESPAVDRLGVGDGEGPSSDWRDDPSSDVNQPPDWKRESIMVSPVSPKSPRRQSHLRDVSG